MIDTHIHSKISFDGYETIEDFAAFADGKRMEEICFIEHVDFLNPYDNDWTGEIDYDEYKRQIALARENHPDVDIRMGVEAGITRENAEMTAQYLKTLELDCVIASQHLIDGRDPYDDKTLFLQYSAHELMERYLLQLYDGICCFSDFDTLGHLGYAARYMDAPRSVTFEEHPEIIDAILEVLIQKDKALEVNTSGFFSTGTIMADISVVRRFLQKGGRMVTIGSDAHFLNVLAHRFDAAAELLRAAGLREVVSFHHRKPAAHAL